MEHVANYDCGQYNINCIACFIFNTVQNKIKSINANGSIVYLQFPLINPEKNTSSAVYTKVKIKTSSLK